MKAREALIAWTPSSDAWGRYPTRGAVKIGPLIKANAPDWTRPYGMTGGAAYLEWRKMPRMNLLAKLFIEFNAMIVRDGIDPQTAHKAFLEINEYREHIAPDMDGAEHPDCWG